jgi:hypothetical protein
MVAYSCPRLNPHHPESLGRSHEVRRHAATIPDLGLCPVAGARATALPLLVVPLLLLIILLLVHLHPQVVVQLEVGPPQVPLTSSIWKKI